ncbi:OB-fold domain-containing protein [Mycobacterium sp. MBM]|nr:OB-fold domain-containing protein [Mycobacterium sp. MBM]
MRRSPRFLDPHVDDVNAFFYEATAEGRLAFQRCGACSTWWSLPAIACFACGAQQFDVVTTGGCGVVHTFAIPRRPGAALIDDDLVFAVIELDEGVRIFSRLVDVDPAAVDFDMRVAVRFAPADTGEMIPVFTPDDSGC